MKTIEQSTSIQGFESRFGANYLAQLALGNQYAHILESERPLSGASVDILKALAQNSPLASLNDRSIKAKRKANEASSPSGLLPIYLTRPLDYFKPGWNGETHNRDELAKHVLNTLKEVYGEEGYPYKWEMVAEQIDSGSLLPYIAYLGPRELSNGTIYEYPDKIKDSNLIPVAVSGINLRPGGWAELGKFAQPALHNKILPIEWFKGGGLVQEMMLDWATNRFGLMEAISLLYADMRVADAHDGNPHSGHVQKLLLGWGQMGIMAVAPMYNVNGYETMMRVARYRDLENIRKINQDRQIFIAPGKHQDLLTLMWKHQLGKDHVPNFVVEQSNSELPSHQTCHFESNGDTIYGEIKIGDGLMEKPNTNIDTALAQLDENSPSTVVQIAADTPQSITTQQYLMSKGFIHCGISAATDDEVLMDIRDRSKGAKRVTAPPVVYMAKLGKPVRQGKIKVSPTYFPEPEESDEVDLHGGPELREALRDVTARMNTVLKS